jgi:hypothetical protein
MVGCPSGGHEEMVAQSDGASNLRIMRNQRAFAHLPIDKRVYIRMKLILLNQSDDFAFGPPGDGPSHVEC